MWGKAMLLVRMVAKPEGGSPWLASTRVSPYLGDRMLRSSILTVLICEESRLGAIKLGVCSSLPTSSILVGALSPLSVHARMDARAHTISAIALQCFID